MNTTRTKIYYNNFFKDFFNEIILVSRIKKSNIVNFKYNKNNLSF